MTATPGPWTLSDDPVRRVIKGAGPKPRTVCIIEDWTTEEDAKLIAAAPALADALAVTLRHLFHDTNESDFIDARNAAREALRSAGRLP